MTERFPEPERQNLLEILRASASFSDADRLSAENIVQQIEQNGYIALAGIGSLLKDKISKEQVSVSKGLIKDFKGAFDVAFTWRGGTRKYPTLMYGGTYKKGATLPCIIQKLNIQDDNGALSAEKAINFIKDFEKRENPPENPIYRRRFMWTDVEGQDKQELCLFCENDPDSPLFIGDQLSLDEKALLLACEWGPAIRTLQDTENGGLQVDKEGNLIVAGYNAAMSRTIYAYLLELIDRRQTNDFPIDEELWELLERATHYRSQMDKNKRIFLESIDSGIIAPPRPDEVERSFVKHEAPYNTKKTFGHYAENRGLNEEHSIYHDIFVDRRGFDVEDLFKYKESLGLPSIDLEEIDAEEIEEKLKNVRIKLRQILNLPPLRSEDLKTRYVDVHQDIVGGEPT